MHVFFCLASYDTHKGIYLGYYDISSHKFQYSFPRSRLFGEFIHLLVLKKASYLTLSHNDVSSRPGNDNSDGNSLKVTLYLSTAAVNTLRTGGVI